MFRIAVCDDVPSVCDELKTMIMDMKNALICGDIIIDVFYSGEALIDNIKEELPYDLIFLDIELVKINGVEVGHIIREQMEDYITKIIYISSKDIYDRQLFDVQPLHFLKKPIDRKKVFSDIQLAMKIAEKENRTFEFKSFRNTIKVPYRDILYFESMGREVILVGVKNNYTFYGNIKNLVDVLPDFFIHPNRSYFVNYEFIACFKFEELIMTDGSVIPISRSKRKEIRELQLIIERKGL
jgi:hypothetical protein CLOSPO_01725